MNIITTSIRDVVVIEPRVFEDDRGYFFESYNESKMPDYLAQVDWVQDNESKSSRGVLRGLHYQCGEHAQAKLVRAIVGEIYDVAIDLRPDSPTYGTYHAEMLSATNKKQMYVPRGFAHGFVVLSETAIFSYKCDNYYNKAAEGGLAYNDPTLSIPWPIAQDQILVSEKDAELPNLGHHKAAL